VAMTRASMGSEFLRDAGVLVLVFAMLDKVVVRPWRGWSWTVGVTLLIFGVSGLLYWMGVRLEEIQTHPLEGKQENGEREVVEEHDND
jgi:hypothetical protein